MDPARRFQHAHALRTALRDAHQQTKRLPRNPRSFIYAAVGLGSLAAGGVIALLLWPTATTKPVEPPPVRELVLEPKTPPVKTPPVETPKELSKVDLPVVVVPSKRAKAELPPSQETKQEQVVTPPPEQTAVSAKTVTPEELAEVKHAADALDAELAKKSLLADDVPGWSGSMANARALVAAKKPAEAKALLGTLQTNLAAATVDKNLVAAKLQRLNAELKARNLPAERAAPVYKLFEQVQAAYFKGDYVSANQSLNQIKAQLDAL